MLIGFKNFLFCIMLQIGSFFSFNAADKCHSEKTTEHKQYIECTGGHLHHHLIDEAISVFEVMDTQDLTGKLKDAVVKFANASLMATEDGNLLTAAYMLDVCWSILDFTEKAGRYKYHTGLNNNLPLVAVIVEETAGLSSSIAPLRDGQVQAVEDVAISFIAMGYCLGRLVHTTAHELPVCHLLNMDQERAEKLLKMGSVDPLLFFTVYQLVKDVPRESAATIDKPFRADITLLGGVEKLVLSIAKESLPIFLSYVYKGVESFGNVTTREDLLVYYTEEMRILLSKIEKN